jgi:hypothetical protein
LRASSAEKLAHAVEAADDAVDDGASPDGALAKAAADYGVPVGHVPFLVRAFNTGRSVRQLGAAGPWEKAASHPVASVEAVVKLLGEVSQKRAAVREDSVADYFSPPPAGPRYVLPSLLTAEEKRAAAPRPEDPIPKPREPDAPTAHVKAAFAAIDSLIELTAALKPLTASEYLAVKAAADETAPDAAAFAFAYVEDGDPWLRAKGASADKLDPRITTDHPAVVAVAKLAAARAVYPKSAGDTTPLGYAPVTDMGMPVDGWYSRLPVDAVFGVPVPAQVLSTVPEPVKSAGIFDRRATTPQPQTQPELEPAVVKSAGFGSGFKTIFGGATNLIGSRPLANEVYRGVSIDKSKDPAGGQLDALSSAFSGVDEHAAIQSILTDPRFVKADPQTLVQTYRDLSGIAPQAMQNPAIASDFLTRKVQTGPLGYHDLQALIQMENNLSSYTRPPVADEDDDKD